jgi:thiamine-monophosphate kinase
MADERMKDEPLHGEEAIIACLVPLARGYPGAFALKDDCALLTPEPGHELVLKTDPIAENVHFLPSTPPGAIAWKALAVNVSDLAAKGATPIGYLLALSFPAAPTAAWMADFVAGLQHAQTRFGCHLLGGDTDRRPGPLAISVTVIGSVPKGQFVPRAGVQPGDVLFVSGSIGDASLGLALTKDPGLAKAWGLSAAEAAYLRDRYDGPEPRLRLAPALRQHASAAMDLSDGLVKDLERMLRASGVAARLDAGDVPLSPAARKATAGAPERLAQLITAGDDYELLAAVPQAKAAEFQAAAAAAAVEVTPVGEAFAGPPQLSVLGPDGHPLALPPQRGWDHF